MKINTQFNYLSSWITRTGTGILLVTLTGCAMIYENTPPLAQIPSTTINLANDIKLARDGWPQALWWKNYHDPQLDAIIERALKTAQSISIAKARIDAGKAQAKLVDASTGPLIGLAATLDRQSVSESGFLGPYGQTIPSLGTTGPWYTAGTIGLAGEYSVDIWGKDQAKIDAAIGVSNARLAEAAQVELALSSQIVYVYYDMQTQYAMKKILEQARNIEQETVAAHQAKAAQGLEPLTPKEIALKNQLELDQQIATTETHIRLLREAMRALIGASTDDMPVLTLQSLPETTGQLPSTLRYELLARRPDLQVMRWYVQASFKQVDAAKAAFYPSFDIRAFAGFDALHLEDLLHRSSRQLNLIPGLSLPVFDSGRLNANLAYTQTQSNELIAQYNQSIVNAVREVAQASIKFEGLQQQIALQKGKLESANFAFNSADAHYQRGLLDKVSAMETKLPLLMEQEKSLALLNDKIHAQVELIAALGGGYNTNTISSTTRN
jgi:efflux transporter, outer membrane factor (OMF) lipoprotein, NodT family